MLFERASGGTLGSRLATSAGECVVAKVGMSGERAGGGIGRVGGRAVMSAVLPRLTKQAPWCCAMLEAIAYDDTCDCQKAFSMIG